MNTTKFKNLFSAIEAKEVESLIRFISNLNKCETVNEILNGWLNASLMTPAKAKAKWEIKPLREYLIDRYKQRQAKELQKQLNHLIMVENAPELLSVSVQIEWKRNRTWGNNPIAEARIETSDKYEYFTSGSIGGCGYDKQSTAFANAVNQSNTFLKAMYEIKEASPDKSNHDLFGYGSGYGVLPRLEGGVGVSCFPRIFKVIGFELQTIANGKTFDVYRTTKQELVQL